MSDSFVEEFLLTQDEHGFVHLDVLGGGSYAFAPCDELDVGEAYLVNREANTCDYVPLEQAFTNVESYPVFLISRDDFMALIDKMASGELKPVNLS